MSVSIPSAVRESGKHAPKIAKVMSTAISADTRKRFDALTFAWKNDRNVMMSANPLAVLKNASYNSIIASGIEMLPLILEDYSIANSMWAPALHKIVGSTPIKPESRGKTELIREDWLNWGRDNGYLRK